MNRRSFLKSAALAAVAVPVVGLPEANTAMLVITQVYPKLGDNVWVIKFRKPNLGHGTGITDDREQAIDWYIRWTNLGYAVNVRYMAVSESRF